MVNLIPTRTDQFPTPKRAYFLEYYLVLFMLLALVVLVIIVLWVPVSGDAASTLEFRRTALTIIVTAFGAWIGAGAAYFFGKENLRVATQSLIDISAPPKERLAQAPVTLKATPLDWTAKMSDQVATIVKQVTDPKYHHWFITVINDDGTLNTVLEDYAVWRFIDQESLNGTAHPEIMNKTVKDVIDYVHANNLKFDQIHVEVRPDQTLEYANDLMDKRNCYLTIIVDDKRIPRSYLTTAEVRKFLLQ
jgi:hypothetical protein